MSILAVALIFFQFSNRATPLPVTPTRSEPEYTSWHSQPRERGSFGLILNCLITLSLCVWTAIHLNVPARRPQGSNYALRRVRWVFLGLLAPELAVYAAWRQWSSARILTKSMSDILLKVLFPPRHNMATQADLQNSVRKNSFTTTNSQIIKAHKQFKDGLSSMVSMRAWAASSSTQPVRKTKNTYLDRLA
jgi:hypothetical protein